MISVHLEARVVNSETDFREVRCHLGQHDCDWRLCLLKRHDAIIKNTTTGDDVDSYLHCCIAWWRVRAIARSFVQFPSRRTWCLRAPDTCTATCLRLSCTQLVHRWYSLDTWSWHKSVESVSFEITSNECPLSHDHPFKKYYLIVQLCQSPVIRFMTGVDQCRIIRWVSMIKTNKVHHQHEWKYGCTLEPFSKKLTLCKCSVNRPVRKFDVTFAV